MTPSPAVWRDYLRRYGPHRGPLILSAALSVMQSLLLVPVAILIKLCFDAILQHRGFWPLLWPCAGILALTLTGAAMAVLARHLSLRVTKRVIHDLRRELLAKSYALASNFSSTDDRAALHSVIVQDTERVDVGSNAVVIVALPSLITGVLFLTALGVLAPWLLLATLAAGPLVLLSNRILGRRLRQLVERFRLAFESFDENILAALRRMELTRLRCAEPMEEARQAPVIDALRRVSGRMAWTGTAYTVTQSATTMFVSIVTLVVGGMAVMRGGMSLADLAAYYFVLAQLGGSLNALWTAVPQILSGADSLGKIAAMQAARRRTPQGGARRHRLDGAVTLRNVHFDYGSEPVLRGVDLALKPGERIAIAGANGSGKSTLAYLILGLYAPHAGEILVDGVPLMTLALDDYRRQIGVALQEPLLFAGTIAENVAYGEADATADDVAHALKLAGAEAFVAALPDGANTRLGAGGIALSGGQGQMLGLARALLGRPKLLILDEPTNHLDEATVAAFFDMLDTLETRPTVIVITHDRAVAGRFDRLYRLENGVLCETGPARIRLVGSSDA